jgi:hypothetical protein
VLAASTAWSGICTLLLLFNEIAQHLPFTVKKRRKLVNNSTSFTICVVFAKKKKQYMSSTYVKGSRLLCKQSLGTSVQAKDMNQRVLI